MNGGREVDALHMGRALRLARRAARVGEVPVGAVLVDKVGRVLAMEHNRTITACDPTAHAEMLALRRAAAAMGNYRLLGTTLYVTLEPCPMCAGALVLSRVDRLVFGTKDPKAGACGSLFNIVQDPRLNHQVEVVPYVLEQECSRILQAFFEKVRRKNLEAGRKG